MKVLMLNGSANPKGNTQRALMEIGGVLEKYFGISRMPTVGSTYWNLAHGSLPGEIEQDAEGLQTLRNLARNMAWLLKSIDAGKKAGLPLPTTERGSVTNFVR